MQLFPLLCDISCHQSVGAIKIRMFLYEPIEDPRSSVALLLPLLLVPFQPAIDLLLVRIQFGNPDLACLRQRLAEILHVSVPLHRFYIKLRSSSDCCIRQVFLKDSSLIQLACAIERTLLSLLESKILSAVPAW